MALRNWGLPPAFDGTEDMSQQMSSLSQGGLFASYEAGQRGASGFISIPNQTVSCTMPNVKGCSVLTSCILLARMS